MYLFLTRYDYSSSRAVSVLKIDLSLDPPKTKYFSVGFYNSATFLTGGILQTGLDSMVTLGSFYCPMNPYYMMTLTRWNKTTGEYITHRQQIWHKTYNGGDMIQDSSAKLWAVAYSDYGDGLIFLNTFTSTLASSTLR